jgi:predicted Zn-dependent protease
MALVQTEMNLKHYDKALAAAAGAREAQPDNPQVANLKGAIYMIKGEPANARAAFEKAVTLKSDFFPAVTNLARLDVQDKKYDAAKQRFEKLLETDKNNFGAMAALGDLAMLQKHTDEATSWYEKGSAANPEAINPALKLGMHYLQINQAPKALTLARKFQPANPTNAEVLELLGQAQVATKDVTGALETYSKLATAAEIASGADAPGRRAHAAAKQ